VLPAALGPEGVLAIPNRNLVVSAGENSSRDDGIWGGLTIYQRTGRMTYPKVESANRADGTPIPWAALSGLAMDPGDMHTLYAIHDSFFQKSRIYTMDVSTDPAVIQEELVPRDTLGLLAAVDLNLVNSDDNTVNLDPEGIATRADGGFWIASEGSGGGVGGTPNLLLKVNASGVIERVVTLPGSVQARKVKYGFEGVASVGSGAAEKVYVAFQREWDGDPANRVRIGRYDTSTDTWSFYYYPLDTPASPHGGWVGLSELVSLGGDDFAVIERDNQAGPDASIKKIYRFSISGLTPRDDSSAGAFDVVSKTVVRNLMPDLMAPGGFVLEKVEGMAVLPNGDTLVVNDNDGVDDSNGETQLIRIPGLF